MTPNHYCAQKAAPAGSAFYYSLLTLPKPQQAAITAIAAFDLELKEIMSECHEPALAYAKFNWWRSEIAKISLGQPTHPVVLALQQACQQFSVTPQHLMDMLDGVEQGVEAVHFATFEDLTLYIMQTAGARELAISAVVSQDQSVAKETIFQLALTLDIVEKIQKLHRYVLNGFIPFPEDEMKNFHITVEDLQALKTTQNIQKLLANQADKAELAYTKVATELSPVACKQQVNLLIRCEMALAVLRVIRAGRFLVLENWMDITQLRRWWISIKTRIRCRVD